MSDSYLYDPDVQKIMDAHGDIINSYVRRLCLYYIKENVNDYERLSGKDVEGIS